MKWLQIARAVLMLLPAIIVGIKAVEEAIPDNAEGPGNGEIKLAAVRGVLEVSYARLDKASLDFTDIWPVLESVIGNLVATFNNVGWGSKEEV